MDTSVIPSIATAVTATVSAATGGSLTLALTSMAGIVTLISNIVTMFIPNDKVSPIVQPIISILDFCAGNLFNNKNVGSK